MATFTVSDAKRQVLQAAGALNPHAATVTDGAFVGHPFFDARDLVQVKYEMVRRVEAEGQSVTHTAAAFGFSRPAFYAAQAALARGGLPALVRQRPGPRRRHKLRPEIVSALDAEQRTAILDLATDLPQVWRDSRTPARERKRLMRLVIEDVTLLRGDQLTAHVRFRGGATRTLQLPLPARAWQLRQTKPEVVAAIDELLNEHTDGEIAALLNERGHRSGLGSCFHSRIVADVRRNYGLANRFERLRAAGFLDKQELANLLNISTTTLKTWHRHGLVNATPYDDKGSVLYPPPSGPAPIKGTHKFTSRPSQRSSTGSPE